MADNEQASKELGEIVQQLSMSDWMLARTRLEMSRQEIQEDELALMVLAAWKKNSGKPGEFVTYMNKGQRELLESLGFDWESLSGADESAA